MISPVAADNAITLPYRKHFANFVIFEPAPGKRRHIGASVARAIWMHPIMAETRATPPHLLRSCSQPKWFALRVRSNFEKPVSNLLQAKGVEEFLPVYPSRRVWADRIRDL